jgi:hypothetical protein
MITDADHLAHLNKGTKQSASQVAESANASAAVLDYMLATDWIRNHTWTRRVIAAHPNLSDEGFETLSNDHDDDVLYALASNPALSPERLEALYEADTHKSITKAIAGNPNIQVNLQCVIAQENLDNSWVLKSLAMNPNLRAGATGIIIQSDNGYVLKELAKSPILTLAAQKRLARSDNAYVRSALASNYELNSAVLTTLATDADSYVRKAVASNPNTTPETVRFLMEDENEWVRKQAGKNRNRHG